MLPCAAFRRALAARARRSHAFITERRLYSRDARLLCPLPDAFWKLYVLYRGASVRNSGTARLGRRVSQVDGGFPKWTVVTSSAPPSQFAISRTKVDLPVASGPTRAI